MFGAAVVCYLFLGGSGAGACAALAVAGFLVPRGYLEFECVGPSGVACRAVVVPEAYRRLFSSGYAAALVALLLGIAFLFVDLGRADRLLLLLQPKPTYLSVGAYALAACVIVSGVAALSWSGLIRFARFWVFRLIGCIQLISALAVMVYTGLLLWDVRALPLWSTPWLAVLFALSAASCGIALLMAIDRLGESSRRFCGYARGLARADLVVMIAEAAAVIGFVVSVGASGEGGTPTALAATASLTRLLAGDLAVVFWGGFIVCGLAAPLLIESGLVLSRRRAPLVAVGASALVLAGGFFLRWCVVEAGAHPAVMTLAGVM